MSASATSPASTDASKKVIPASKVALPKWETLTIAGGAGMFAWCFTHPFEMWKNTVMTSPEGTSQVAAFKMTAKKGFYTGLSSGLVRQIVYTTARLGCYPIFRDGILQAEHKMGLKKDADPISANLLDRALAGAAAGVFASFLSSPVEVCLVLQTTGKEKTSMVQAARSVIANSGVKGFWRGFGALGSRAALVGVSQVAVHDQVLTMLRKYNHTRPQQMNDNLVVNIASVITAFIYGVITMPVEVARVRMSAEAKLAAGAEKKYTNVVQCIGRIAKEEGVLAMYDAFLPYFCRCAMHTVLCFFTIEYVSRELKRRKAASMGMVLQE